MLLASERPLVIAGGGGWTPQSAQALQRFAENWRLPVGNAFRFQDTFDNHHPLYAGDVGIGLNPKLAARVKASDLIIAIGLCVDYSAHVAHRFLVERSGSREDRVRTTLIHIGPAVLNGGVSTFIAFILLGPIL